MWERFSGASIMKRVAALAFGILSYGAFLGAFLYAIGFLGNVLVPRAVDSPATGPVGTALVINSLLLALFAIQHSVMARPGFKAWWTGHVIPPEVERSTYVLLSSLALLLLFWQWQPMGGVVWNVQLPVGRVLLWGLFALGWLTVLITTFLINHWDLFGLRQVWLYFRRQPYQPVSFRMPGPYKYVRHPLYVGWLLAFWSTPTMTVAHLLFAVATTVYILVAIQLEERDLTAFHGAAYAQYRQRVPMLIPMGRSRNA
jgi:protein-S-isoprenylcysteine O-methyltransferase Ste14